MFWGWLVNVSDSFFWIWTLVWCLLNLGYGLYYRWGSSHFVRLFVSLCFVLCALVISNWFCEHLRLVGFVLELIELWYLLFRFEFAWGVCRLLCLAFRVSIAEKCLFEFWGGLGGLLLCGLIVVGLKGCWLLIEFVGLICC